MVDQIAAPTGPGGMSGGVLGRLTGSDSGALAGGPGGPRGLRALGVDIGGTGIKGAVVDTANGEVVSERYRIPTPQPATPDAVCEVVARVVDHFGHDGPVGVTFPGVVRHGVVSSAANVDPAWLGADLRQWIDPHLELPGSYLNDADAAAVAEARFGAARDVPGLVIVVTFGTGIGTGLVHDGRLVPNAELGHLEIDGHDAESRASAAARKRDGLDWPAWTERASRYLDTLGRLFSPDLLVVGGGISKKPDKWFTQLRTETRVVLAKLINNAGIVGAAATAAEATPGTREVGAGDQAGLSTGGASRG